MNNMIKAIKNIPENTISFYLKNDQGEFYLFRQKFTQGVYEYFKNGRCENEIRNYHNWCHNPKLDHTVTSLPKYIRYVMKYEIEPTECRTKPQKITAIYNKYDDLMNWKLDA